MSAAGIVGEREREIELYLVRRVRAVGGLCVKFLPDFARGFPDRLVLFPDGTVIWAELKRPKGGRLSTTQRVAHERLRKLRQRVEILMSREEVDALMREWESKAEAEAE